MRSRFAFEKMTFLVLTLVLFFAFSACGGGKAVNSDPVAKDSGINEAREVKQLPQSAQKETQTEKARDGRFIAYDNGTVLDTQTGLIWPEEDNGRDITWANAKFYCEDYRGGGYKDWRMPTQDELAGLYDGSKSYKATQRDYNVKLTELIRLSACCPWASDTRSSDAAYFYFFEGLRYWDPQSNAYDFRALPVRSGK
jgi:hypothetical protein